MLDPAEGAFVDHFPQQGARRRVPEFEVAERDHARRTRLGFEIRRLVGVERKLFVTQHRLALAQRETYVRGVQERRRVHADQIDVRTRRRGAHRAFVASRYDIDDLAVLRLGEH